MHSIRIVEFPACKMATSGYSTEAEPFAEDGQLMRFGDWWSAYDKTRRDKWFPRDFLMFERENKALIWFYALPEGEEADCPFDIVDFEGGLYAASVSIDGDYDDEQAVYGSIKAWVAGSEGFALDERPGHYDLSHTITSAEAEKALGYRQLEIYVPIKIKTGKQ